MKTFIRRPGNKSKHLKHILPLIPKEFNTYIEPFLGSGAVFLALVQNLKSKWIINDLNNDIINIWKLVRDNPSFLLNEINKFKKQILPLNNDERLKLCKYKTSLLKNINNKDKKTALYLILIYCSFQGSLQRSNKICFDGLYSQLYNKSSVHLFAEEYSKKINILSELLSKGKIYCNDYTKILVKAQKGDFVFLDPPYIEEKTYTFDYIHNNRTFDTATLRYELKKLDSKGVKWMMTQIDDNDFVKELLSKYRYFRYKNKSCMTGANSGKSEVIIMNY